MIASPVVERTPTPEISSDAGVVRFYCPGCKRSHEFVDGVGPGERWLWNHNYHEPSVSPAILVLSPGGQIVCHVAIRVGQLEYLDGEHALRGIVAMSPVSEHREDDPMM